MSLTIPISGSPVLAVYQPLTVNLDVYQGDDIRLDLTVTDSVGNPIDTTGWTAAATVRAAPGTKVVASWTCTIVSNVVQLWLPHNQSMALQRRGVWDCQVTNAAGDVTTLAAGSITAALEVTTA